MCFQGLFSHTDFKDFICGGDGNLFSAKARTHTPVTTALGKASGAHGQPWL